MIRLLFICACVICACTSIEEESQQQKTIPATRTNIDSTSTNLTNKTYVQTDSVLIDQRDQHSYKIKRFGNLWWMIDNLNYTTGDSLFYKKAYIGMASYSLDGNPENGKKHGQVYDLPAATKACPSGWRLPTMKEWTTLNENHSNCTWDRASPTGNYRDSLPDYQPRANVTGQWIGHLQKVQLFLSPNIASYWCQENKNTHALIYTVNTEQCHATPVKVGSTIKSLSQQLFYTCRCVQEI